MFVVLFLLLSLFASSRRALDVEGAAKYLRVSERTLRAMVARGELTFCRVGRLLRFRPEDLDSFLDARRVEAREPVAQ